MSSRYYATVYDIVKPIATFLHPIRVEGLENLPQGELLLLCPNHSSNWDPILLMCALGRSVNLRIMGKNQLFKIPILRTFLRKMGVFPVDRGHSDIGAVKTSIQALRDGDLLMVFPEGTRVREKNRGVRPKGGVAMMAIYHPAALLRELTKKFESVERGTLSELAARFSDTEPKGECVICVLAAQEEHAPVETDALDALLLRALGDGFSVKDAAALAVERLGVKKKDAYARALDLREEEA